MGLDFAIDELMSTGWTALDTSGCQRSGARPYPTVTRVAEEFRAAGLDFSVRRVQLFDCCRAEWHDQSGQVAGAVVGQTEAEAAVYALAQLRRQLATVGA